MARTLNIQTHQGANLKVQAYVLDQNNLPVDLSNANVEGTIKYSGWSSNVTANLICTIGDGANGEFMFELYPETTINIDATRYVYTVMCENNNAKSVLISGNLEIKPGLS